MEFISRNQGVWAVLAILRVLILVLFTSFAGKHGLFLKFGFDIINLLKENAAFPKMSAAKFLTQISNLDLK